MSPAMMPFLPLAMASPQIPFLVDLLVISGVVLVAGIVCDLLRIPTVVGYLITGIMAGPHALGLVREQEVVDAIAEVGVIFLLFSIGVEFSLKSFASMKKIIVGGGILQAGLTIAACIPLYGLFFNGSINQAVFFGFLIFLSSTAIGIKLLQQRGEDGTPSGRIAIGICIFQDLLIVPLMLAAPLLAGKGSAVAGGGLPALLGKGVSVVALAVLGSRYLIPWAFFKVSKIRDREVFLLTVVWVVLSTAWLTAWVGLSLALGAFLSGMLLSESEYGDRALGSILPFRDVFLSLFFISVGMLLDVSVLLHRPLFVLGLTAIVIGVKILGAGAAVVCLGYPPRVALQTALVLSQVGEFSFVLSRTGVGLGLLDAANYQAFLAVSILTMIATPGMIAMGPRVGKWVQRAIPHKPVAMVPPSDLDPLAELNGHLIIVGFGPTGRYVARAARAAQIKYAVIEMNPETVRTERERGELIVHGDASDETVLELVGVERARAILLVIADTRASRSVAQLASSLNPTLRVIVRTRYIAEIDALIAAGADEVVPEELETAVEILGRVLRQYLVSEEQIDRFAAELRSDGYRLLRTAPAAAAAAAKRDLLPEMAISRVRLEPGFKMGGRTIAELELRRRYGVTVLAVRRDGFNTINPDGGFTLQDGDELVILEGDERMSGVVRKLSAERG